MRISIYSICWGGPRPVRLGNFAVSKQASPLAGEGLEKQCGCSHPPEWKVGREPRPTGRGGGWSLLYCSRPSPATGGGRKEAHARGRRESHVPRRIEIQPTMDQLRRETPPEEPNALACGQSSPLPHLLLATCDGSAAR
jgi:hypothetical protein